jgi:hypothetical protein
MHYQLLIAESYRVRVTRAMPDPGPCSPDFATLSVAASRGIPHDVATSSAVASGVTLAASRVMRHAQPQGDPPRRATLPIATNAELERRCWDPPE